MNGKEVVLIRVGTSCSKVYDGSNRTEVYSYHIKVSDSYSWSPQVLIQISRLLPCCSSTILNTNSKLAEGRRGSEPSDTKVKGWVRTAGKRNE